MFDFLTYIPLVGGALSGLVPFIIALSVVVFVHEYGHYIVGRWCGIHAEAFSIGFGRVLTSWVDKRGTKWQIAALPLGGYVKFLGDANSASGTTDQAGIDALPDEMAQRTFTGAKLYRKALTVFAGPAVNFVFSTVVFAILFVSTGVYTNDPVVGEVYQFHGIESQLQKDDVIRSIDGITISTNEDLRKLREVDQPALTSSYTVTRNGETISVTGPYLWLPAVAAVTPTSPAARAGLKEGDLILKVGDRQINSFVQLQEVIVSSTEERVPLLVQRGADKVSLSIKPRKSAYEKEDGTFGEKVQIGVQARLAFDPKIIRVGPVEAAIFGAKKVLFIAQGFVSTITQLLTGGLSPKNLNGPLGIAVASSDTASQGFFEFVHFIAFVSTAIGLMNLLPIPVLDGGHLLIFAYQAVFRRAPNEKFLHVVMLAGFSFLIMLVAYATFYDGLRFFG
ncbi:MAG: RIP metalloprotease RseP [Rhodobacteraceae bacterium]|nr:RIP metalloprotease RseP [Paracoccaceae bacterium]